MVLRMTFSGSQQIIEEVCEHCGEKIEDVQHSEIIVQKDTDKRRLRMQDRDGQRRELFKKADKIAGIKASASAQGMYDRAIDGDDLKYSVRAERMCSSSDGTTTQFCYRVTNPKFLAKTKADGTSLSASFFDPNEPLINETGSKVGLDRRGNVVRLKEETKEGGSRRQKGAFGVTWFANLDARRQKTVLEQYRGCSYMLRLGAQQASAEDVPGFQKGEMGEGLATFRSLEEFKLAHSRYCS
tara:strand:- start:1992 stop:2714 length:723 start_codon:yes stop_codon:yes gene_type:complete